MNNKFSAGVIIFILFIILLTIPTITGFVSCKKGITETNNAQKSNDTMSYKIKVIIGSSSFTATISNSATSSALKAMLPMTVNMIEMNGNEKYFNLHASLPVNASDPATLHSGDLMLYGSNTLVLFYKTFSTSYSYTNLGRIDDTTGLAAALGSGNVTVTFELL